MTLFTQGTSARVAPAGSSLIPVTLVAGMLSLLLFQGVRPVTLSTSPSIIRESCALYTGSPSAFPLALGWAGAVPRPVPPLGAPLLPPPLPHSGLLGNVVAHDLRPLIGTLWCTDQDFPVGLSCRVDGR